MLRKLYNKLRLREPYTEKPLTIENPDSFAWDKSCDLAIAGFGGAGAAAALEAEEQGLETLVIERFEGGGATNISGGIFYAGGGTDIQQQAGIEDDPQNMFNYLQHEVQGAVSDETLKKFCNDSVDNFNWMVKNGVPFEASFCPFKTSYPPDHYYFYYSGNESFPPYSNHARPAARGHRAKQKGVSGQAIFQPLRDSARRKGLQVLTQSKLVGLVTDKQGDVIGLKAIELGGNAPARAMHRFLGWLHIMMRYTALYWPPLFQLFAMISEWLERRFGRACYIRARRGVVLTTGGFYANQAMIQEHAPQYSGGSPLGTLTDDGSGIKLAQALGADTALMDSVSCWRFLNPPLAFMNGVLVGPSGKRICNEMLYGAQVGDKMMKEHEGKAWLILDDKYYRAARHDLTLKKGLWFHVMLGIFYMRLGSKKAPSIAALANKIGVDALALEKTLAAYNQQAQSNGDDPLGKPKDWVNAQTEAPFHAINASYDYFWVPGPSLTLGGLKVEETSGRVLHRDGQPINGLYAAGRTAVGIPSRGYVSGLSIADCIFSGRRAARHAAAADSKQQAA